MARNGTKTGGRAKGTPNKKTTELIELLGDYNPIQRLIEIAKDERNWDFRYYGERVKK